MSINSLSSINTSNSQITQSSQVSPARKLKQDFDALAQALNSGDLSTAKQAFATFQQDLHSFQSRGVQQSPAGQQTGQVSQSNPQDALAALSQSLSSGDLTGAQNAFSSLLQDLQGQAGAGHPLGHHHHSSGAQTSSGAATATTTVDTTA